MPPSTKSSYGLLLTNKGEVKKSKLTNIHEDMTLQIIQTILKKKDVPICLATYDYESYTLHLFGYSSGKAGTENKHELPPPFDELICFGDILLIASPLGKGWSQSVSFTPEQYESFYNKQYGGFEDMDSEEDDESEIDPTEQVVDEIEEEIQKEADTKASMKKKNIDEGIEDEDEEEEEEEEEEAEEEEDVEGEDEKIEDEEEDVPVVKKRTSAKKKPVKASISHGHNTGRAKQQHLLEAHKIFPIVYEPGTHRPIPSDTNTEMKMRSHVIKNISSFVLPAKMNPESVEDVVFESAYHDAKKKNICIHFDNPLFLVLYKSAARRVIGNISPSSYVQNTQIIQKLEKSYLTLEHLRSMNIMEYAPHLYNDLRERQDLREQNQLEAHKAMATDMFKCGRCHIRETTYYELQTRSADEPMTKFITCVNCGNHWRQ